jgi:hypothetical protein
MMDEFEILKDPPHTPGRSSVVLARHGPKAPALAWLEAAQAFLKVKPGPGHAKVTSPIHTMDSFFYRLDWAKILAL